MYTMFADIGSGLNLIMFSRLPLLLLVLASAFISFETWVEAVRYDPADVSKENKDDSVQHVSDSRIVVLFQVVDNTPADSRFKKEIGCGHARQVLNEATGFVLRLFNQFAIRRGYLSVKLTVESFGECKNASTPIKVAKTTGNHIWLNSDYIEQFKGDVKSEFDGIMYHETTNVWQWNGQGKAPKWLLSGIADYVRLKSGRPSKDWSKWSWFSSWTDGYAVTAYFIEYCSHIHNGFVAELNSMMKTCYSDEYFVKLLGKSVDKLWKDYKGTYFANKSSTPAPAPAPSAKHER